MPSTKRWEEVTRNLADQPGDAERMAAARARLPTKTAYATSPK